MAEPTIITTRAEAHRLGIKRYYSGVPCPQGHVGARFTKDYSCVRCFLDYIKARKRALRPVSSRPCLQCDAVIPERPDGLRGRIKKFCSDRCNDRHHGTKNLERRSRLDKLRRHAKARAQGREIKSYVAAVTTCKQCNTPFEHYASKARVFCSVRCRQRHESNRRKRLTCPQCRTTFLLPLKGRPTQRYCSYKCAGEARRGESDTTPKALRKLARRQEKRDRGRSRPRTCRYCEATFIPRHNARQTCSDYCRNVLRGGSHARRAKRLGLAWESVNRITVFARDNWICQMCGERTPKRLLGRVHPRAPELDHRIPLALGGPHLYSNVQCSCRLCNGKKGGTRVLGQLPLFPKLGVRVGA